MSVLTHTVEEIIKAGGNVSVDSSDFISLSLLSFTKLAVSKNAHLTIRNANKMLSPTLIQIAKEGGKNVTLEV